MASASSSSSSFASKDEEIAHWKKLFEESERTNEEIETEWKKKRDEVEDELEDLQLLHLEMQIKLEEVLTEKEEITNKSREKHAQTMQETSFLEKKLNKFKNMAETCSIEKRKLEQENDDLERRERELSASVRDVTEKMESAMETNVLLLVEVEESRVSSQEAIQRLKDEIRDQKHELSVRSLELDALQRQLPRFERKTRMLTPNLSPLGFVSEMLSVVKDIETALKKAKRMPNPSVHK